MGSEFEYAGVSAANVDVAARLIKQIENSVVSWIVRIGRP